MSAGASDLDSLLRSLDDPDHMWSPKDLDYQDFLQRFAALGVELDRVFECSCVRIEGIQDAAFYGGFGIPAEATTTGSRLTVRNSFFGYLAIYGVEGNFTGHTDRELAEIVALNDRERIAQALALTGYTLVARDLLSRRYDGANTHWRASTWGPTLTWFDRFFNYH